MGFMGLFDITNIYNWCVTEFACINLFEYGRWPQQYNCKAGDYDKQMQ